MGRGEGIATTSPTRRVSRALDAHPRGKLLALLSAPLAWLALAYIGSLTALLITAFYKTDPFTTQIVKEFTLQNFSDLFDPAYRTVAIRTILVAATVTVIDFLIAMPMAFTLAKVVSDRARRLLLVLVLMPLWASYLVKAYSWRAMLAPNGIVHEVFGHTPGYGLAATIITLSYLWLPYMIIPIYAGLERLPNSMLEAASDLGAKSGRTFFSVVVPLAEAGDHRGQHLHVLTQPRRLHQRRHRRRHHADDRQRGAAELRRQQHPVRRRAGDDPGRRDGHLPLRRPPHGRAGQPVTAGL